MTRISFIFGTRPEAIKLCPLIQAMQDHPTLEPHVCVTGQHRHMLDQVLQVFGIVPDVDLSLMRSNQSLAAFTSRAVGACDRYLAEAAPAMVLVQGDTTTAFCAALASFYRHVRIGHVEAGLRTWRKCSPFPEEVNRVLTSRLADYHFAPTEQSRQNLLAEGVPQDRIFITGNTVVDAVHWAIAKIRQEPPEIPGLAPAGTAACGRRRMVLITCHRRESFGQGVASICRAIAGLAEWFPTVDFVFPVHLNPNVRVPVSQSLAGRANVFLIEPLDYLAFVALMDRADVIMTDSGGVQEEAASLGKPVLVMRDATERPEAAILGDLRLVSTDGESIVENVWSLLARSPSSHNTSVTLSPYGDGRACERIVAALEEILADRLCGV